MRLVLQYCRNVPCSSFTRGRSKGMEHRGWLWLYDGPLVAKCLWKASKPWQEASLGSDAFFTSARSQQRPCWNNHTCKIISTYLATSTWFWSQPTKDTEMSDSLWHKCDTGHINSPESIPDSPTARTNLGQAGTAHQGSNAADNPWEILLAKQNQMQQLLLWRIQIWSGHIARTGISLRMLSLPPQPPVERAKRTPSTEPGLAHNSRAQKKARGSKRTNI